jgi:GNAT superfamily N-acetyltransferase
MFSNRAGDLGPPPADLRVIHAAPPSLGFYRYLYDAVGGRWHWYDRKRLSDQALAAIIHDPLVEIHVGYRRGSPIGYVELDRRIPRQCEISYFGLIAEVMGHGFGAWFLRWSVHQAWRDATLARLWVHTCSLDHASALPVYQKVGFETFAHEQHRQYIVVPT